jgi:hypothetical protein
LLEAVEELDEEADVVRSSVVDEARQLLTVDVFRQVAVEEGVPGVELVYRAVAHWRDVARWSTVWMDHRGECLVEINAQSLQEAVHNNPSCLAAPVSRWGVKPVLQNPLAGDHVAVRWSWNKSPCPVG